MSEVKPKIRPRRDDMPAPSQEGNYSHPVYKRLSQINGEVNRLKKAELQIRLQQHGLDSKGVKDVLKKRLKMYYKYKNLALNHISSPTQVKYNYVLVIDFEATCNSSNPDHYKHEIIEFPVVVVDCDSKCIIDTFQSFVKPVLNPTLTPFCTELTGITQQQVDAADTFPQVLENTWAWIKKKRYHIKSAIVTDGPWDMSRFFYLQCQISKIPYPKWARRWINIRKSFSNYYDTQRQNINQMLETLGMTFEGRPHSGLDDAINIARVLIRMLTDGCKLIINEGLTTQQMQTNAKRKLRLKAEVAPIPRKDAEAIDSYSDSKESDLEESDTDSQDAEAILSDSNSESNPGCIDDRSTLTDAKKLTEGVEVLTISHNGK